MEMTPIFYTTTSFGITKSQPALPSTEKIANPLKCSSFSLDGLAFGLKKKKHNMHLHVHVILESYI